MFYVYTYKDPITRNIFYVGKGQKYRMNYHIKPSSWDKPQDTTNPFLYGKIKSLMIKNTPPIIEVIEEFDNEQAAYDYECILINDYGTFNNGGILLNISTSSGGSPSGIKKPWTDERKSAHKERCKKTRVFDPSYIELYEMYVELNMTRNEIAIKFNVSDVLIKKRLNEHGIKKPKKLSDINKMREVECICNNCNISYFVIPSRSKVSKYCSYECSREARKGVKLGKRI